LSSSTRITVDCQGGWSIQSGVSRYTATDVRRSRPNRLRRYRDPPGGWHPSALLLGDRAALRAWEVRYNTERFSMALQGRTPTEKLAALTAAA
jgi:transposase InsO family protein